MRDLPKNFLPPQLAATVLFIFAANYTSSNRRAQILKITLPSFVKIKKGLKMVDEKGCYLIYKLSKANE